MKYSSMQAFTSAVVAAGHRFVREAGRLFKPFGLTVPQFDVLELLSHAPAGLRQNRLAASLVVDPSTATYVVDALEKRAWVRRTADPADRRAYCVVLTDAGRAVHARASQPYLAALAQLQKQLDPKAVDAATKLLESLPEVAAEAAERALD